LVESKHVGSVRDEVRRILVVNSMAGDEGNILGADVAMKRLRGRMAVSYDRLTNCSSRVMQKRGNPESSATNDPDHIISCLIKGRSAISRAILIDLSTRRW
jgi:hypothetical protein